MMEVIAKDVGSCVEGNFEEIKVGHSPYTGYTRPHHVSNFMSIQFPLSEVKVKCPLHLFISEN